MTMLKTFEHTIGSRESLKCIVRTNLLSTLVLSLDVPTYNVTEHHCLTI